MEQCDYYEKMRPIYLRVDVLLLNACSIVCGCVFIYLEKDIRQQAVSEMMERIKKGIQLRPVGQTANKARPQQVSRTHTQY